MTFGSVPDIEGLPGIHMEVKRVERLNLWDAMAQSIRDSERFGDGVPTVFHRRNRSPWLVTMRLDDWLSLYEQGRLDREMKNYDWGRLMAEMEGLSVNGRAGVAYDDPIAGREMLNE